MARLACGVDSEDKQRMAPFLFGLSCNSLLLLLRDGFVSSWFKR